MPLVFAVRFGARGKVVVLLTEQRDSYAGPSRSGRNRRERERERAKEGESERARERESERERERERESRNTARVGAREGEKEVMTMMMRSAVSGVCRRGLE